ncbi:TetR family transcriptional regulator [Rhodococcus rhodnii]|uniref:TetR family transcriptional regulator n=1 Tax=Rhodococcus rhodnii TaxID=38312 RepID=UPI000906E2AC|nr:TetR family transcriptional regulator [Rhodococcus rhodnii]
MTGDEIASEVGCSRATFYVHFPGKVEILERSAPKRPASCRPARISTEPSRRSRDMSLSGSQSPIAALLIRWSSSRTISTAQPMSSLAR